MEGEQFSLCWNNFHSNLSSGFHSLLKDEDLVDCTLAAEGKYLKAHKTVLSVCSPFFKELFRVNPCKHPIVILPDVNYAALCSLLHFMYQGEVSVSQEEIPTFMRVAETLKVKGLTDNGNSSDTNGYTNSNNKHSYGMSQRELMKRPKPVKKIIRPIQQVRPASSPSPNAIKSPQHQPQLPLNQPSPSPTQQSTSGQPAAKRPHLDETPSRSPVSTPTPDPPLIKPKQEPVDHSDDAPPSEEETSMDVSHLLDTQLGETSGWPANQEAAKQMMHDTSSPGTLQCILGRRGNPRLIVDGYVFYKKSVYKGKAFWYCKNSRTPEKCQAVCWTMNGNIVKWPYMHTHPVIPDVFNPDEDTEVPIENLQEVLWQTSLS